MRLQHLHVKNFRNYRESDLIFANGKNLLLGPNGQGKTNLLEAIYLLSHARSNRASSDRELMRMGETYAGISATITSHRFESRTHLEIQWVIGEDNRLKTVFKLNGAPVTNRSQILGYLPTVSFFVSDLLLLRGAPEDRRKWLDAAVIQYDKRHFSYVSDFQKVRLQKNRLLKEYGYQTSRSHLEVWNQQFAKTGAKLMASRLHYLGLVQDLVVVKYIELSAGQETLELFYQSTGTSRKMTELLMETNLEECLYQELIKTLILKQEEEIRRGTALIGPHRDDLGFYLSGMNATAYGSQGQQRTIVLALKLTELSLLTQKIAEPPILLLDDVMAELDPGRQQFLLEAIEDEMQVFLTTTHLDYALEPFLKQRFEAEQIALFDIDEGSVSIREFIGV